jgi:hypothetical protein
MSNLTIAGLLTVLTRVVGLVERGASLQDGIRVLQSTLTLMVEQDRDPTDEELDALAQSIRDRSDRIKSHRID